MSPKHRKLAYFIVIGILFLGSFFILLNFSSVKRTHLAFGKSPEFGINYYASGRLWRDFWEQYSETVVEEDFKKIKSLHLKVVRVFLYQEYFASQTTSESALGKLTHLLNTATKNDLKVIITLFDWSKPYSFEIGSSQISKNFEYGAIRVLEKFAGNPAVHSWDLKNEPDHDFVSEGRVKVSEWLLQALKYLRSRWPKESFTVGWLWLFHDLEVNGELNYLSFHHFPEQGPLDPRVARFKNDFPNSKIYLEEVGRTTYFEGISAKGSVENAEKAQSSFLEDAVVVSIVNKLGGILFWNLYDHPVSGGPARPPQENRFGILRENGSHKPFADILKSGIFLREFRHIDGGLQFCVSATGRSSSIKMEFKSLTGFLVSDEIFELQSGFNCFDLNGFKYRLARLFSGTIIIEYTGLVAIDGMTPLDSGTRVIEF